MAGADAMNLAGIVVPGARVAAVPGRFVRFRNGSVVPEVGESSLGEQGSVVLEGVVAAQELRLF